MDDSWFRLRRKKGPDLLIHWMVFAGILVLGLLRRDAGGILGAVLVILVHEMGHALVARAFGARVIQIELHVFGGRCVHEPARTELGTIAIAWGGVLAQAALFCVGLGLARVDSLVSSSFLDSLLTWNALIALLNLIPIATLDGVVAWRIVPYLAKRFVAALRGGRPWRAPAAGRPSRVREIGPYAPRARTSNDDLIIDDEEAVAIAARALADAKRAGK